MVLHFSFLPTTIPPQHAVYSKFEIVPVRYRLNAVKVNGQHHTWLTVHMRYSHIIYICSTLTHAWHTPWWGHGTGPWSRHGLEDIYLMCHTPWRMQSTYTVESLYKDTPEMRTSPLIRTPCIVPVVSFNQDTMHSPSYIEMCIKQPLKWRYLL